MDGRMMSVGNGYDIAVTVGENRRTADKSRSMLLAVADRELSRGVTARERAGEGKGTFVSQNINDS
jgi:hypothetical protein